MRELNTHFSEDILILYVACKRIIDVKPEILEPLRRKIKTDQDFWGSKEATPSKEECSSNLVQTWNKHKICAKVRKIIQIQDLLSQF